METETAAGRRAAPLQLGGAIEGPPWASFVKFCSRMRREKVALGPQVAQAELVLAAVLRPCVWPASGRLCAEWRHALLAERRKGRPLQCTYKALWAHLHTVYPSSCSHGLWRVTLAAECRRQSLGPQRAGPLAALSWAATQKRAGKQLVPFNCRARGPTVAGWPAAFPLWKLRSLFVRPADCCY